MSDVCSRSHTNPTVAGQGHPNLFTQYLTPSSQLPQGVLHQSVTLYLPGNKIREGLKGTSEVVVVPEKGDPFNNPM